MTPQVEVGRKGCWAVLVSGNIYFLNHFISGCWERRPVLSAPPHCFSTWMSDLTALTHTAFVVLLSMMQNAREARPWKAGTFHCTMMPISCCVWLFFCARLCFVCMSERRFSKLLCVILFHTHPEMHTHTLNSLIVSHVSRQSSD